MKTPHYTFQLKNPNFRNLGYLTWFILGIMSLVFYKERATFMDGGFQLYDLINTGTPSIHHYRITNPLTQIVPLIAIKLKLSLKVVMILYSFNFIIYQSTLYILIVKWCKNDLLGLVQLCFFTLMVTESFYFLTPEFYQGMSILLLWFAMILKYDFKNHKWLFPVLALLLIPILFDHALLSIFFGFSWLFFGLHVKKLRNKYYVALFAIMSIIYIVKSKYFVSWYDQDRQDYFFKHLAKYQSELWAIPANKIFLDQCVSIYYWFPLLLICIIIFYSTALFKKWNIQHPILKLFLVVGFSFSYLLINHINDPQTPFLHYSQVNYIGLMIPIGIAICFDLVYRFQHIKALPYILGAIFISRLIIISTTQHVFEERHKWIYNQLPPEGHAKIIIQSKDVPKEKLIQLWSIPEESMLITALEGPENAKTVTVVTSARKYKQFLTSRDTILRFYSEQDQNELNPTYFKLQLVHYKEK